MSDGALAHYHGRHRCTVRCACGEPAWRYIELLDAWLCLECFIDRILRPVDVE